MIWKTWEEVEARGMIAWHLRKLLRVWCAFREHTPVKISDDGRRPKDAPSYCWRCGYKV